MVTPVRKPDRLVQLAVDLLNTCFDGFDLLCTRRDLREFLVAHGEQEPVEVDFYDVLDVVGLRTRLRAVFTAETEAEAAGLLNELLAEFATVPYLSDHDGTGWHLHVAKPDAKWAEWLAAQTAAGLARLLGEGGFDRIRVCAEPECRTVFIEQSRNHTQRYCGPTCASRARVTAYRARRSGDGAARSGASRARVSRSAELGPGMSTAWEPWWE